MRVGSVIGKVVLSEALPELKGARWLIVSPLDRETLKAPWEEGLSGEETTVVYDHLGAGQGDVVGFSEGGEATRPFDHPMPIDSYNAVILDHLEYKPN